MRAKQFYDCSFKGFIPEWFTTDRSKPGCFTFFFFFFFFFLLSFCCHLIWSLEKKRVGLLVCCFLVCSVYLYPCGTSGCTATCECGTFH